MKNVPNECVGIVSISPLPKHTCRRQQKSILFLGLVVIHLVEICLVSLNGIGKQDETRHNLKIEALMDKQLVMLESWHPITTI